MFFIFLLATQAFSQPIVVTGDKLQEKRLSEHYNTTLIERESFNEEPHFEELVKRLPGVTAAGGTGRSRFYQIRGIGERSSYEGMPNESVTILLDGIDYTGFGAILDTVALGALEVYKGPQNTVMGPSSLAGSIRAFSVTPDKNRSWAKGTMGNFDQRFLELGHTHKGDNLSVMVGGALKKSDGYFRNVYLGRDDTNNIDEKTVKTKVLYEQGAHELEFNVHIFDFENGYDVFNLENDKTTRSDHPGADHQETYGMSLVHTFKRPSFVLKSIFGGHNTETLYAYDEDWGNNPFWLNLPSFNSVYDYRIEFTKDTQVFHLEERLNWGRGDVLHTTGLFFKNTHQSSRELGFNKGAVRKDLRATFKRRRVALFHESEFLGESVNPFVGLRLSRYDSQYFDNNQIQVDPEENLWGAHLGLKKEWGASLASVRLSRGFKAGGVNIGSSITADRRSFEEESLYGIDLTYETRQGPIGAKLNLFGAYREDVQVKTSFQDNPSDPSSFTFYTDNATTGYSYGAEGELSWQALPFYSLEARLNLMDTRYGAYTYGARNLKGREFAYAPNYQGNLRHHFLLGSGLYFEWENIWSDGFYFGNSHDERAPHSLMTDVRLGIKRDQLHGMIWVQNIFNERTESRGFYFGNRPPNYNDEKFVQVGPPRSFGVTLSWEL